MSCAARPKAIRILRNKKRQPREEMAKIIGGDGEHGVDGVAAGVGEIIAAHAVMFLERHAV